MERKRVKTRGMRKNREESQQAIVPWKPREGSVLRRMAQSTMKNILKRSRKMVNGMFPTLSNVVFSDLSKSHFTEWGAS